MQFLKTYIMTLLIVMISCREPTTAESAYTAALLRCVDKAETISDSKACRAQVDKQFGIDRGKQ
jgi:hypothetical protein